MNYLETSTTKKFVAGFLGIAVALSLSLGVTLPVQASTASDIAAQIAALQAQLATLNGGSTSGFTFTKNLKVGDTNSDVLQLQKVLNANAATQIASSGAGSPGNETSYFGGKTRAAVVKYQSIKGISPTSGFVGPITRAQLNAGATTGTTPPTTGTGTGTTPPVAMGTGLTVAAGTQPAPQLAPLSAARVPFTTLTLTAGNDGDVAVTGIVVQRGGPSTDAAFTGIVLLDENGNQIGLAKTLNSSHQATLPAVTVPKGTTRTLTIAANRRTTDSSAVDAGAVATFSVIQVNTAASVSGSLPIVGTAQTLNDGLAIGSITVQKGPLDPNAQAGGVTKNVGTTGYTFSSIKVTAGSVEDVLVKSIRWNQASSSSNSDLANLMTVVDGVSYPVTVDATGKYYTSTFGTGITIAKGFSKEISIKGDIIGGSGRSVAFNIEKTTDLNVSGLLFGYGITPPTSGTGFSAGTIWYAGSTISVNSGTITVTSNPAVAAQNIAVNVANQPLGGYIVTVQGEPITVASSVFGLDVVGAGNPDSNITNVSLVNQNGAVLAGPVDESNGIVTFTDTITYPVGVTNITLKGKIGTTFTNNNTVKASTTPSSNWSTVTGQVTGTTIVPAPSSQIGANTMTVKSAALTVSTLPDPIAQTVVAGGQGFVFSKFNLDAGASGEDVRISSLPLFYTTSGTASYLTNCQLWDGSTSLTTGSNMVNPTSAGSNTFVLDNALVIAKGTSKLLTFSCNISSSATTGSYQWGITSSPTATGVTSGQSVTVTLNSSTGQAMAMTSGGTITVTLDSSTPTYRTVTAGTTGNTVAVLRVRATNENMNLQTVALQLSSTTASTNSDVTNVTLWDGTTQIGSAIFDGTTNALGQFLATSTLTSPLSVTTSADKLITIKVDAPAQGNNLAGHPGSLIAVDWDGGANIGTKAVGASSGTTVYATGSDTAVGGVRVFKSVPTFTYSTTGTTLVSGVNDLLTLNVAADPKGDIQLRKLTFSISSSTASLTGNNITFSGPNGNVQASSTLEVQTTSSGTALVYVVFDSTSNTTDKTVSAGTSKTYVLRGTVALTGNSNQNGSMSIALKADTPYLSAPSSSMYTNASTTLVTTAVAANQNIIWSPLSTTTSVSTGASGSNDWTNGYGLPGCFTGLGQDCTARTLSK